MFLKALKLASLVSTFSHSVILVVSVAGQDLLILKLKLKIYLLLDNIKKFSISLGKKMDQ